MNGQRKAFFRGYPHNRFVRYADDAVIHCKNEEVANELKHVIGKRMNEIGLRLNEEKTKIVYCKDYRRMGQHDKVQFGFLGYSFQPREGKSKFSDKHITTFTPEISKDNQKKIRTEIKETVRWRSTHQTIEQIADRLNSKLRGWLNYFGLFGKRELRKTMLYLEWKLARWIGKKHKKGKKGSFETLQKAKAQNRKLFYHWGSWVLLLTIKEMTRAV